MIISGEAFKILLQPYNYDEAKVIFDLDHCKFVDNIPFSDYKEGYDDDYVADCIKFGMTVDKHDKILIFTNDIIFTATPTTYFNPHNPTITLISNGVSIDMEVEDLDRVEVNLTPKGEEIAELVNSDILNVLASQY